MHWRNLFAISLIIACIGCSGGPALTVVHEPGLDTARAKMFGIYQGDTKVASLSMDATAPLAGASVCVCDDGTPCTKGADGICRKSDGTPCKCNPAADSGPVAGSAPSAPAVTVSPVTGWPDGCVLEVWVGEQCGPCEDFVENQLPRLPSGVTTVKRIALLEDEAKAKRVPGGPYFIIYKPGGDELIRVKGFVTAESLVESATRSLNKAQAPQARTAATGTKPGAFVATGFTGDVPWAGVPETWPALVPINGTRTPSKSVLIWHLNGGGSGGANHVSSIHSGWDYDQMTPGQLATLHDGDHGLGPMGGGTRYGTTMNVRYVSTPTTQRTYTKTRARACRNCL